MGTFQRAWQYCVTLSLKKNTFTRDAWAKTREDAINIVLEQLNEAEQYQADVIKVERVVKDEI